MRKPTANTQLDECRSAIAVWHRPLPRGLTNAESNLSVFPWSQNWSPQVRRPLRLFSKESTWGVLDPASPIHFPRLWPSWRKASILCVCQSGVLGIVVWRTKAMDSRIRLTSSKTWQEIFRNWERETNLPVLSPYLSLSLVLRIVAQDSLGSPGEPWAYTLPALASRVLELQRCAIISRLKWDFWDTDMEDACRS